MPRDFDTVQNTGDGTRVPDLTYENAKEHMTAADYVMFSIGPALPGKPLDETPLEFPKTDRLMQLKNEFNTEFEEELFAELSYATQQKHGKNYHVKLSPSSPHVFDRIEAFLERMVPLWSYAAISYCWTDQEQQRANTLLYQLEDSMPPHPKTPRYYDEHDELDSVQEPSQMTEEEFEEYVAERDRYFEYEDSKDNPRFTYGPTHVLNGDYHAAGSDILAFGWDEFGIDIRFDVGKTERQAEIFPTTYNSPFYQSVMNYVEDYPDNIGVAEVIKEQTQIREKDIPVTTTARSKNND